MRLGVKQRTLGNRINADSLCHGGKLPPTTSRTLVHSVCQSAAAASHSGCLRQKSWPANCVASCPVWQVTCSRGPRVLREVKYQVHQTIRLCQRGEICLSTAAWSGKYLRTLIWVETFTQLWPVMKMNYDDYFCFILFYSQHTVRS